MKRLTLKKLLLAALSPFAVNTHAQENAIDLETILESIKSAKSIKIYIAPPNTAFVTQLNEFRLKQVGYEYDLVDFFDVKSIAETVLQNKPKNNETDLKSFEPRIGIYFKFENNAEIKFLFNKIYAGDEFLNGVFEQIRDSKSFPVIVSSTIQKDLFNFLHDYEVRHPKSNITPQERIWLDFIKDYKNAKW